MHASAKVAASGPRQIGSARSSRSEPSLIQKSAHGFEIEVYLSIEAARALAEDWSQLCARIEDDGFFVNPAWCFAWFEHIGHTVDAVAVVVLRQRGQLRAVLPLAAQSIGPFRAAFPFGTGSGQYGELLADVDMPGPDADAEADALLRRFVVWHRPDWI